MYVVTAQLDGDTWSYGPFTDHNAAHDLAEKLGEKYPQTDYQVGDLFDPNDEELLRELAA